MRESCVMALQPRAVSASQEHIAAGAYVRASNTAIVVGQSVAAARFSAAVDYRCSAATSARRVCAIGCVGKDTGIVTRRRNAASGTIVRIQIH